MVKEGKGVKLKSEAMVCEDPYYLDKSFDLEYFSRLGTKRVHEFGCRR